MVKSEKQQFQNHHFLVQVISQNVLFNEEIAQVCYFKDITFGVLQDQIQAQERIQKLISSSLHHKIGQPLQKLADQTINL